VVIPTFATRCPIGPLGPEVVLAVLARTTTVLVLIAPRILGDSLFEVRTVPIVYIRIPLKRVEPLAGVRIAPHIEPILVERRPQQLDLRPRRRLLRLPDASKQPRPDEPHEQPQHDDDHQQLDEREPPLINEATPNEWAPSSLPEIAGFFTRNGGSGGRARAGAGEPLRAACSQRADAASRSIRRE